MRALWLAVVTLVVCLAWMGRSFVRLVADHEYEYWAPRLAVRVIRIASLALSPDTRVRWREEWTAELFDEDHRRGPVSFVVAEVLPTVPLLVLRRAGWGLASEPGRLLGLEVSIGVALQFWFTAAAPQPERYASASAGGYGLAVAIVAIGLLITHLMGDGWVSRVHAFAARLIGKPVPLGARERTLLLAAGVALDHALLAFHFVFSSAPMAVAVGQGLAVALTALILVSRWWDRRVAAPDG